MLTYEEMRLPELVLSVLVLCVPLIVGVWSRPLGETRYRTWLEPSFLKNTLERVQIAFVVMSGVMGILWLYSSFGYSMTLDDWRPVHLSEDWEQRWTLKLMGAAALSYLVEVWLGAQKMSRFYR